MTNGRLQVWLGILLGIVIVAGLGAVVSQGGPQPPVMPPIDLAFTKAGASAVVETVNPNQPQLVKYEFDVTGQAPGQIRVAAEYEKPTGGTFVISFDVVAVPKNFAPHAFRVVAQKIVLLSELGYGGFRGR